LLPLRYLSIPITANRLSKMEYRSLVDKITARITTWSTRNLSYAGRAALIQPVLMQIFTFCARILILPQGVIKQIMALCRNFLWGAASEYKKAPYVAWTEVCLPKANGGVGLKNLDAWNKAWIAKLVWEVAKKKDSLWIKWVHEKYLMNKDWWDYTTVNDVCWY